MIRDSAAVFANTDMPMPTIRLAKFSDAAQLAEFAERTFRAAFGGANTMENMNLHCTTNYRAALQAAEIANPEMLTLICEENKNFIAFAQLHWGNAPPCVSARRPGEIQRFYVENNWHGKGIAQELMSACMAQMEQREADVAWLGVWEKNPRAISFYQKLGFREVGAHTFKLGLDLQRDLVMARRVGSITTNS